MSERPHVVIVGAGFGGLWAAKKLARADVDVTIIDRNNYHTFFPLLYQVAAAELRPSDIAYPIRSIVRRYKSTTFRMGNVEGMDLDASTLTVDAETVSYDFLIFAPGSVTRHFGVTGAEEHAFGLRTLDDGLILRNHLLRAFEAASRDSDAREALLRVLIVGGGPTGVEFAGALQEFMVGPFRREFPELVNAPTEVRLVEASDALIGMYPARLSAYAIKRLSKMGVSVDLGQTVDHVHVDGAVINGSFVPAATVVWTAGVGGDERHHGWGLPGGRAATVAVTAALNVEGHPNVFVVGDGADPGDGAGPMVAQNALQQGRHAARNILAELRGIEQAPFVYKDLGNMAVIGRNAAVVHLWNRLPLTGFIAWIIWLAVHLAKLIGFRNRLAALISWTGDYLFGDRVARLIIPGWRARR